MKYKTELTYSFILFWSISMAVSIVMGGILFCALTIAMALVLISHEYAHVLRCEDLGIPIKEIKFTWLGGMVNAELKHSYEVVEVLFAGVLDTAAYCIAFAGMLMLAYLFGASSYIGFFQSMVTFALILTITNVLPISYKHPVHGLITTDGYGAWMFLEQSQEIWNDAKIQAEMVSLPKSLFPQT